MTVSPYSISVTQPYALIISGEVGELKYKKNKDKMVVIIAIVMVVVLVGFTVYSIVDTYRSCASKRKRDKTKASVQPVNEEEGKSESSAAAPANMRSNAVRPAHRTNRKVSMLM